MPAMQDVFYPTGFSLTELTASIESISHLPTQLGDSGLFNYAGIPTTTVQIERQGTTLGLVAAKARGSAGQAIGRSTRDLIPFNVVHLPLFDQVLADEVQGVRMFGTTDQPTPVQRRVMEVLGIGKGRIDYTLENMRVGALKGQIIDADGSTVLLDLFTAFGVTQQTLDMQLDVAATDVRSMCDTLDNMMDDTLEGVGRTGMEAWCGRDFWQKLISHKSVRETWLNQSLAAELRGSMGQTLDFGGITWRKYRGKANGTDMIGASDAYVVPTGVPDLFIGRFGPGDYNDTVNTIGLPIYAQGIPKANNKGWDIDMQSNPFHLNTRPRASIKVTV